MLILYRDEGGYVVAKVDTETISFLDGEVYFDCDGKDFKIPVSTVVTITNEE